MSTAEQQRRWRSSQGARTGQPGRPAVAPCGTVAAYKRHLRHGDTPDQMCKDAWAEWHRANYRKVAPTNTTSTPQQEKD